MLLAFDTATACCSVALRSGSETHERVLVDIRQHAVRILPMIDELLAEAGATLRQLDAIAFGCGPGSFTGLRIAVAVAQGLGFSSDRPLLPISTLAALAQEGFAGDPGEHSHCVAALDARMGEVYWGLFRREQGLATAVGAERLTRPAEVPVPSLAAGQGWFGAGNGWAVEEMPVAPLCWPEREPRARSLLELAIAAWQRGEAVAADRVRPVYLRNEVATVPTGMR